MFIQAAAYAVVQIAGAVCGALLASVIDIGYSYSSWGVNHTGPGCGPVDVEPIHYVAIFVWEFLGTFVLVHRAARPPARRTPRPLTTSPLRAPPLRLSACSMHRMCTLAPHTQMRTLHAHCTCSAQNSTVCATAVSKPGFGPVAPIAIGASIFVSVAAGGGFSGGFFKCVHADAYALHMLCVCPVSTLRACPFCARLHVHMHVHVHVHSCARYLGPSLVYGCGLDLAWLYLPAQVCAPRREAHATAHHHSMRRALSHTTGLSGATSSAQLLGALSAGLAFTKLLEPRVPSTEILDGQPARALSTLSSGSIDIGHYGLPARTLSGTLSQTMLSTVVRTSLASGSITVGLLDDGPAPSARPGPDFRLPAARRPLQTDRSYAHPAHEADRFS